MTYRGYEFYDDNAVFEKYMKTRTKIDNPNDIVEKPILLNLIGNVQECCVLDVGCGNAMIASDLFARGCRKYIGVDGSSNMISNAKDLLAGKDSEIVLSSLEDWEPEHASVDVAISRMAIHYIDDLKSLFHKVSSSLVPSGRFVFSVEHPLFTSHYYSADDYFDVGKKTVPWLGAKVTKYHHTTEEYVNALIDSGFAITTLKTSEKAPFLSQKENEIPAVLFVSTRKNN